MPLKCGRRQVGELLFALIAKDLKIRYKNTILGVFWSIANPTLTALIFFVAFKHLLSSSGEGYLAFLFAGTFPWHWFSSTVTQAPGIFLQDALILKKIRFPRVLLPVAAVCSNLVHFVLALVVLVPFMVWQGAAPTWQWAFCIPMLLAVQGALILGFALALSVWNVKFRDVHHLTTVAVNLLFFLTPVVYRESQIPDRFRWVFLLNPMGYVVSSWRKLLVAGAVDWNLLGVGAAFSVGLLLAGYAVYRSMEGRLAEYV